MKITQTMNTKISSWSHIDLHSTRKHQEEFSQYHFTADLQDDYMSHNGGGADDAKLLALSHPRRSVLLG